MAQLGINQLLNKLSVPSDPYVSYDGTTPPLVADFDEEYYRANGSRVPFSSLLTYSTTSTSTMVDSDGLLKWAPHNLLTYSEQFDNAAWTKTTSGTGTTPTVTPGFEDMNGGTGAWRIQAYRSAAGYSLVQQSVSTDLGTYTTGVWVKSNTESSQTIYFRGAATGTAVVTTSWQYISMSDAGVSTVYFTVGTRDTETCDLSIDILVYLPTVYRSDLGGMVSVPADARVADSTTYVPTTSAAVYLPRRGHHVYNGAEWVNEGLLIESEARTNLLLNSGTLATQDVTVTAVPHTLSFTGTGTITLSGVSTDGPLVGTGTGENNRVSLTFTPTAGTLTHTVTGTVTNAQLEAGSTASSYIPTGSATVTRAAQTATIAAANLAWPSDSAYNARAALVAAGWTITDGGAV